MKVKEYKKTMKRVFMIISGFLMLFSLGCRNGNDGKTPLNENDFTQNPSLVATTDKVVIINLEHPDATDVDENDSFVPGCDWKYNHWDINSEGKTLEVTIDYWLLPLWLTGLHPYICNDFYLYTAEKSLGSDMPVPVMKAEK